MSDTQLPRVVRQPGWRLTEDELRDQANRRTATQRSRGRPPPRSGTGTAKRALRMRARVLTPAVGGRAGAGIAHRHLWRERQHLHVRAPWIGEARTRRQSGRADQLREQGVVVARTKLIARRPVDQCALDVGGIARQPTGDVDVAEEAVLGLSARLVCQIAVAWVTKKAIVAKRVVRDDVAPGVEETDPARQLGATGTAGAGWRRLAIGVVVDHDAPGTLIVDAIAGDGVEHAARNLDAGAYGGRARNAERGYVRVVVIVHIIVLDKRARTAAAWA